jgi:predicted secreted Zn-dependent protease
MDRNRQYKLSVVWKTMDKESRIDFLDDSQQYFLPRLKLEKDADGTYNLLDTAVDIYRPYEDSFVEYAYEHGLRALSDALCYSYHFDRLEMLQNNEKDVTEASIDRHKKALNGFNLNKVIHINQIKSNYGNFTKTEQNSARV